MGMSFDDIWRVADARVASGRVPGYVGAVRVRGHVEIHAAGRTAVEPDSPPMRTDTLFRIASITKPMGGALDAEPGRGRGRVAGRRGGAVGAGARVPAGAARPGRAAGGHGAGGASGDDPAPADAHLGVGRRARAVADRRGDDRAGRVRERDGPLDHGRRVHRAGGRAAARVPARRGLALRDEHEPARHRARAGDGAVARCADGGADLRAAGDARHGVRRRGPGAAGRGLHADAKTAWS